VGQSAKPATRRRKRLTRFGWQWRRNALRRRTDLVEAWLGVITALALCLSPLVGWWAGHSADRTLQRVVRTQRTERILVTATVVPSGRYAGTAASGASAENHAAAPRLSDVLRWTAPDRSTHTETVPVDLEVWQDGKVLLWIDHSGRLVPPPLDSTTATTHAVLAGTAAATCAAGLLVITRQLLMWRLMRRRMASWEREWARVGQYWGRMGAGG
jgi:hypothetical protein